MRSLLVSGLVGFGLFGFNTTGLADSPRSGGIQMADIDRLVRPQDDLFSYANGTWLRNVPIPADRSHFGVDTLMQEHSLVQQRELLEQALASNHVDARKAALFYASYMDALSVERAGLSPLRIELKTIETLRSLADLAGRLGHLEKIGVATPIELYVQPDAKNTTRYALWVTQSGLGLPDRDYYLKEDGHYRDLRAKYQAHVEKLLRLSGDVTAAKAAEAILRFETQVAKVQWTVIDRRDPKKTYNPQTLGQIQALAPAIEWHDYLTAAGIAPTPVTLVIRQPDYLKALSELFRITPLSTLKAYLRFRLISDYGQFLPHVLADEDFAFNEGVLHDTPRLPERWKRACLLIDHLMGDALGRIYAERFFPGNAKTGAGQIVINLMSAYADSIEHLDWLSPATRQQALLKLKKMRVRIGYPAIWRDYAALEIKQHDLLGNVIRARALESARQFGKLTRTVDLNEWEMTVPTVDAGYNPATNSIEFPAGILQPPLYDPSADDAYNYGNTGATIGHEISHAFDNRGSQYDGDGALRDWWTPQDHAAFMTRTDLLIKEFDAFEPVTGHHVNGTLTLPENIADLAGLEIAYKAYVVTLKGREAPVIDGWTGAQRFFIGYAQSYLGKRRQELLIAQLASNPHAPEADRVNGIVPHLESFYTAFAVKPSDKMYMAPGLRIDLW